GGRRARRGTAARSRLLGVGVLALVTGPPEARGLGGLGRGEPDLGHGAVVVRRPGLVVQLRVLVALDREAVRGLVRVVQRGVAALAVRRLLGGGALLDGLGRLRGLGGLGGLLLGGGGLLGRRRGSGLLLLRRGDPAGALGLVGDGLLRDQLDHRHGGVVALARQRLRDPRVATV